MQKLLLFRFPKISLLVAGLLFTLAGWTQQSISGKVVSAEDQQPVIGATVKVKGGNTGTVTDAEGHFNLLATADATLVVSNIGFLPQEVKPDRQSHVTVLLVPDQKALSEVVVTALGIKKEMKKIGYAVQEVKGEDLVKARDPNPVTALTGRVAGLSVGPNAEMLRKPNVLLRGNEITLYVVDGIPINSDTWNLSPDDIETITVLKGPAAAALYGNRAQYGAILITTKKGTKSKKGFAVEVNSSTMFDKGFLAFPRLQDEYGPGENGLYAFVDGKGGGLNDADYDVWGPRFEGQKIPQYDGPIDPATGQRIPTPWVARGKDNLRRFLQTGMLATNHLAVTSSGDNYNLRFSVSHTYQKSIVPNMKLNITNFNIYGNYNVNPRLKLEANLNYNRQYTPNFPDVNYGPNSLIYNIAIWTGADWNVADMRHYWQPGKEGVQSLFAEYQRYHNPYFMVYEWLRGHYKNDLYGYTSLSYEFSKHLKLTARTQVTLYDLFRNEKMPYSAHPYGREEGKGDYREDKRSLFENNTEVLLNFNKSFPRQIQLTGFVGGNIRSFKYNSSYVTTNYLSVPNVYSFSNSLNPVIASNFASDMRVMSAYYSLDLSLSKYLTLSATGRIDQTTALPPKNNAYFYPSLSMATVLSDYVLLPHSISFLKIRGSYANVKGGGTVATIGATPGTDFPLGYGDNYQSSYEGPSYEFSSVYSIGRLYNNESAAFYSNTLIDPNIKPLNRTSYEGGFDVKFLNNRLGLSATYYNYIDGPSIFSQSISPTTGYTTYRINAVKTSKTGVELTLNANPVRSYSGINWELLINWATYKEKYTTLPPGLNKLYDFFQQGDRVDKLYGSAFVRTKEGQIVHDNAGKPLVNPVRQYLGNYDPDYTWAVYNKLRWNHFSLGFQFDGSVGGVMADYMHNKTMRGGRNIETVQGKYGAARYQDYLHANDPNYKGSFVAAGVVVANGGQIDYDPVTGQIRNYDKLQFAPNSKTVFIQDYISKYYNVVEANLMSKTFAKLREITLSYDLPDTWLKKTFMSRATLSFVARNMLYFVKDQRFSDVDIDQYNGRTYYTVLQTPTTRRFGFNVNIVF